MMVSYKVFLRNAPRDNSIRLKGNISSKNLSYFSKNFETVRHRFVAKFKKTKTSTKNKILADFWNRKERKNEGASVPENMCIKFRVLVLESS